VSKIFVVKATGRGILLSRSGVCFLMDDTKAKAAPPAAEDASKNITKIINKIFRIEPCFLFFFFFVVIFSPMGI
jgi:hypothetical protein